MLLMYWRSNKNEKEKLNIMSKFGAWTTCNSRYPLLSLRTLGQCKFGTVQGEIRVLFWTGNAKSLIRY